MDINDTLEGSKERADFIALALANIRKEMKARKELKALTEGTDASTVQIECDIIDI